MACTLLILKPDAYERHLEADILARVAAAGLRVARAERRRLSRTEVEELYREHRGKPFFKTNTDFLLSGSVGLFVIGGEGDVAGRVRELIGHKDPRRAARGTIRGDFGGDRTRVERNLVHASSSAVEAEREMRLLLGDTMTGRDHV